MPTAILAAVLVYTGCRLVDHASLAPAGGLFGTMPVLVYATTLVTIVATDLLKGIMAGFVLSGLQVLDTLTRFDVRVKEDDAGRHVHLDGTGTFMRLPKLLSALERCLRQFITQSAPAVH